MIKAAFFDVDGTLYSHQTSRVPPSTCAAIAKLQARGILCIVATGRHPIELAALPIEDIGFDAYLLMNGQMMLDRQKNMLFSVPVSEKVKKTLVDHFERRLYPALILEENDIYLNFSNDRVVQAQAHFSLPMPKTGAYTGKDIYQFCLYINPEEESLLSDITDECVITRWHNYGIDLLAKGGGKMVGIQRYLDAIGVTPDEIIAFGDGHNDAEMLRFAGIGVAMGNAEDATKAAADFVTADIDDDGIARALQHFNLI